MKDFCTKKSFIIIIMQLKLLHTSFLVSTSFLVLCSPFFCSSCSKGWWFHFAVIGGVGMDVMASCQHLGSFGKDKMSMLMVSSSL